MALRAAPVFACAATCTAPGPEPLAPDTTVSHEALLDAVQTHAAAAPTETMTEPPLAGMVCAVGLIVNEQPLPCSTVNVMSAIFSVPCRDAPVFAAAVKPTEPFPDPLAPEMIDSHAALLVAVHAHPPLPETLTEPLPPAPGMFCPDEEREYEQPFPCWTVNVCPPAVIAPLRDGPPLGATVKLTLPVPVPLPPAEMVIHGTAEDAVQPHPPPVWTLKVPCPPLSPMLALVDDSENVQPEP